MKMQRLSECLPATGTVTEIVVSDATLQARSSAKAHDDVSYLQADHLRTRSGGHVDQEGLWIGLSWKVPEDCTAQQVADALTAYARHHDTLQGWFAEQPASAVGFERLTISPELIDFEPGEALESTSVYEDVSAILRRSCSPFEPFGYRAVLITSEAQARVVVAMDHTYSDAASLLLAYAELDSHLRGQDVPQLPSASYQEHAVREREVGAAMTIEDEAVGLWADFFLKGQPNPDLGRFPVPMAEAGEVFELAPYRVVMFTEEEAARLEAVAKEAGSTLPALLFAACGLAAHDEYGDDTFRFVNPVQTRTVENLGSAGWFVGLVPIHIDIAADDDLLTISRRVRAEFSRLRPTSAVPFLRVYELAGQAAGSGEVSSWGGRHMCSYMDTRLVPCSDTWVAQDMTLVSDAGNDTNVSAWIFRGPEQTEVLAGGPMNPESGEAIVRYYEAARDRLLALLPAAG